MLISPLTLVNNQTEFYTRPGKRLEKTMENHHAINGKIHYFNSNFQ